ncbi:hypothetical protein BU24DRAFT_253112 [Aaosphaeria arxii CBS 175.79]|uniref:Uncharacterized protein n=1 Tax=Aaosphaeria arxii CBS 175.79 TaxID=1450172 RepID=A0A6A5XHZ5_9PLEO|nr:uncharacterized protein BU24DRAFT_253112 [Aaosphaeria arxii CBS 175.79]KAF2012499.1 hypothetical protein BU24DRAFT_253112 [Aaosphaeria arxii CBS 175.79]
MRTQMLDHIIYPFLLDGRSRFYVLSVMPNYFSGIPGPLFVFFLGLCLAVEMITFALDSSLRVVGGFLDKMVDAAQRKRAGSTCVDATVCRKMDGLFVSEGWSGRNIIMNRFSLSRKSNISTGTVPGWHNGAIILLTNEHQLVNVIFIMVMLSSDCS